MFHPKETVPMKLYGMLRDYYTGEFRDRPEDYEGTLGFKGASILYQEDVQPFEFEVAGVSVDAIDVDTIKFLSGDEFSEFEDSNRIIGGFTAGKDGYKAQVEPPDGIGRSDAYMYFFCGGEMLPTILPRVDMIPSTDFARGVELNSDQCLRLFEIIKNLKPAKIGQVTFSSSLKD